VIGDAFQSIDCICFRVNWEEVNLELLLKVSLGSDGENASVCFLTKYVFGPLGSTTTFEEHESPKNPLLFVVELFWGQADVQGAGVLETHSRCDVLCQSLEGRRAWDAFVLPSEQGAEMPEGMVQAKEGCLIRAKGGD